jgi:hypothetical protein
MNLPQRDAGLHFAIFKGNRHLQTLESHETNGCFHATLDITPVEEGSADVN